MSRLYPAALALLLVAGSYASTAFSQDSAATESTATETIASQEPVRLPDEITVVSRRTLLNMRYQFQREEDLLYRMFNDLNSNDEFDIKCRKVKRLSHIGRRECEPKFFSRARTANAIMGVADMRSGIGEPGANNISMERGLSLLETDLELGEQEGTKFDAMNEEIFRLAMENPGYLKVLMRVHTLKADYKAKWQERFGKKN